MVRLEDVKIGIQIKIRSVVCVVTGSDKHGFTAEQEYKGQKHTLTIPFESFDNPHLDQMILA